MMTHSIESITQEATLHDAEDGQASFTVAVSGGSGTGKSCLSLELKRTLGNQATVLHQDYYQLGYRFPGLDSSPYRHDDPLNFQLDRVEADLNILRSGRSVHIPHFDLLASEPKDLLEVGPAPVLLVDGIYAAYGGLRRYIDRSIYVEAPLYARFLRRLYRNTHEQGIRNPEVAVRHCFGPVLRAHRDFVRTQKDSADVVEAVPYSFERTIARFALEPLDGESVHDEVWSNNGLAFFVDETKEDRRFSVVWQDDLYCQFPVAPPQAVLVRAVKDFEEC